jgi:hypothetical protein
MSILPNVDCPLDGTALTLPVTERCDLPDGGIAMVVTDPGTFHRHMRDTHPERWEEACERQRQMNANPNITFMPRKVDGTFLLDGQDVGDTA